MPGVYGVDCEMCYTSVGLELTKVFSFYYCLLNLIITTPLENLIMALKFLRLSCVSTSEECLDYLAHFFAVMPLVDQLCLNWSFYFNIINILIIFR